MWYLKGREGATCLDGVTYCAAQEHSDVIVVFRTHVKPQAELEQLNTLNQQMVALVSQMPGFLSLKDFSAQDGEFLVMAEFDALESVDAWKAHPERLAAQRRGREEFFAEYRIQVCHVLRTSDFTAASGQ